MNDGDGVVDFNAAPGAEHDLLRFDMTAMGASTVLTLVNGLSARAAVSTFLWDAASQRLSWDADGTGAQAAVFVARLDGVTALDGNDFLLV